MRREHYISLDVHCAFTEMVVMTGRGRVTKRQRCRTNVPALVAAIGSVARPRYVTFEEGPMADWLFRSLTPHAEEVLVCEPRRNHLIAKDSDKDDPIDAEKLAQLFRGGYLKRVHHAESQERALFKHHVSLYHDSVRQRVAQANYVMAQFRRHGVFLKEAAFAASSERPRWLRRLPGSQSLHNDIRALWDVYDSHCRQQQAFEKELVRQARRQEVVRRFVQVPGVGWIRGATFYAYVDTPWRFRSKSALWKYLGIGLERRHSGEGPARLRVARQAHRRLKGMILGAAITAITRSKNPFERQYKHWIIEGGLSPRNARRNVARSLAATLWGMWKNGSDYQAQWVGVGP